MSKPNRTFRPSAPPRGLVLLLGAAVLLVASATAAAPINYGDFMGDAVFYGDVTETATSAGDAEPLLGAPSIHGDILDFDPASFHATDEGAGYDLTESALEFELVSSDNKALRELRILVAGDYSLVGNTGGEAADVLYELEIVEIEMLAVDGVPLTTPFALGSASLSGSASLPGGEGFAEPWILVLDYDVDAALLEAGWRQGGATHLSIELRTTLAAAGDPGAIASIAAKDLHVDATPLPEPGMAPVLGLGALLLAGLRPDSRKFRPKA